jgi:hypothetical protein
MTPKEKAEEIYNKCLDKIQGLEGTEWWESAKQCALIAVDEIIKFGNQAGIREPMMYWYKVKEELEKL